MPKIYKSHNDPLDKIISPLVWNTKARELYKLCPDGNFGKELNRITKEIMESRSQFNEVWLQKITEKLMIYYLEIQANGITYFEMLNKIVSECNQTRDLDIDDVSHIVDKNNITDGFKSFYEYEELFSDACERMAGQLKEYVAV